MEFKTEFPDYVAIEKYVKQERLERSLRLAELIAVAIVSTLKALKAFADRSPLRGSRIPWGPGDQLPKAPVAQD
jgi:hypothetical protein